MTIKTPGVTKYQFLLPSKFIQCSACTPEDAKIRKKDTTKKHCIECLKDKELACFDLKDKWRHRFDTCRDCRKPTATEKACRQCHIRKHVNEFGSNSSGNKYDRCLACQHPLCGYCGVQLTRLWTPNPKAVNALPCCDSKKCRQKKHRA